MAGGDGFERGSSGEGVSDEDAASFHDDDDDDDGTADTFDQALEAELADEDDQGAQKPNEWSWDERNDRAGANERTSSLSSKSGKKRALESDSECRHEVVWFGMCTECGEAVNESEEAEKSSSRVKFQYVAGGVEATQERAETLKEEQLRIALSNRKFLLVLDLDHTLVNTCLLSDLNQEELDILTNWERQEELHFWSGSDLCTKFRPNCWQFLSRVSELCDLYVFTMGNREYAEQVVTMLDPDGTRFSSRVISAQDASEESSKSLDIVVGKEEGVLIVDDSPNVWRNHEDNVIPIERYLFFPPSAHHFFPSGHSLLELHSDENASDDPSSCPLMAILDVICSIHSSYFNLIDSGLGADVRRVRAERRAKVLQRVSIVFSRLIPDDGSPPEHQEPWRIATELGAECSTHITESTTHVVAADVGTDKAREASKRNLHVICPEWLHLCSARWQHLSEEPFRLA